MTEEVDSPKIERLSPKSLRLRFETVGSIAAIVVGVAALFVSWYQTRVMQAQQHAAVWPILTIDQGINVENGNLIFEVTVLNAGVGPAILVADELTNMEQQLSSWTQYSALLPDSIPRPDITQRASIRGRALSPGNSFSPRRYIWKDIENRGDIAALIEKAYADADVEICYCSVFEKCWSMSSASDEQATAVKRCSSSSTPLD